MNFEELWNVIISDLKPKLEQSKGLAIFVSKRAKFEGWLKVEFCATLAKFVDSVAPERNRIDVTFDDWAIELKTINTNYRVANVENKQRPITRNVEGVLKDIEKLHKSSYLKKAVLFVVFPAKHGKRWMTQLERIRKKASLKRATFLFLNGVEGDIYLGFL
jgi:hypothetical protein